MESYGAWPAAVLCCDTEEPGNSGLLVSYTTLARLAFATQSGARMDVHMHGSASGCPISHNTATKQ